MQQDNKTKKYVPGEASRRCFGDFARFISEQVIEKYGSSYETQEELRNSWRDKYEYRAEIEKFLIRKANLFIRTLNSRLPSSSDLGFLHALVREIADYLSRYTMRKKPCMLRKEAIRELESELWDNNSYIKDMRTRQANNRYARKSPKYAAQKRKEEHREKARQEREIQQQIKATFIESAYYRKK